MWAGAGGHCSIHGSARTVRRRWSTSSSAEKRSTACRKLAVSTQSDPRCQGSTWVPNAGANRWIALAFPAWVLLLSVVILLTPPPDRTAAAA